MGSDDGLMPSTVSEHVSWFDRFAGWASRVVSRAWFFAACVALIVVWAPSYWLFESVDSWQLVINSITTVVTFVLVALLQNSQQRADQAVQHKLNAVAAGLAALMDATVKDVDEIDEAAARELDQALDELRAAVGLEERESS